MIRSLPTRTLVALASAAAVFWSLAAQTPVGHAAPTTRTVTLKHISFVRSTVRIHQGDSIKWVWKDPTVPHNVTFAARHSTTKQTGTYKLRFAEAGTFRYRCTIHPGMDGKVVVR